MPARPPAPRCHCWCREAHQAYQKGRYAAALQLARPLAEQGDARAQFLLGLMYAKGQGVPQDPGEAAKWYRLAAEQGDVQAQYELAWLYATGDGVTQDYVAAHMWLNLTGASLPASDSRRRGAAANRDAVESKMTRAQIADAVNGRASGCRSDLSTADKTAFANSRHHPTVRILDLTQCICMAS